MPNDASSSFPGALSIVESVPEPVMFGPALIKYTHKVYDELLRRAEEQQNPDSTYEFYIYDGAIGKIFPELGISMAHYARLWRVLQDAGCVEFLVKGSRYQTSRLRVWKRHPPTEKDFTNERLTGKRHVGRILQDLEKRTAALEGWQLGVTHQGGLNVGKALVDHEHRLNELTALIEDFGNQLSSMERKLAELTTLATNGSNT